MHYPTAFFTFIIVLTGFFAGLLGIPKVHASGYWGTYGYSMPGYSSYVSSPVSGSSYYNPYTYGYSQAVSYPAHTSYGSAASCCGCAAYQNCGYNCGTYQSGYSQGTYSSGTYMNMPAYYGGASPSYGNYGYYGY